MPPQVAGVNLLYQILMKMFTLQQIKAVHATVKSGADFPRYVQEIKTLGLVTYEFMVGDGRTIYFGADNYRVEAPPIYPVKQINTTASAQRLENNIHIHQKGQTDFLTFCAQAAEAGVRNWEINTQTMLCTYYDLKGQAIVAEPIPQGDYVTQS